MTQADSTTTLTISTCQKEATDWFRHLRDRIYAQFEALEEEASTYNGEAGQFIRTSWQRPEGGGGEMSVMKGRLFEKVGVNISTVHGEFSDAFKNEIPGAADDPRFWAAGISLVAHMTNPHVPAIHMNTRFIVVGDGGMNGDDGRWWFGGGTDLNPMFEDEDMTNLFHAKLKACCDAHDKAYYPKYRDWCDEYFYIKHRKESRGVGGIFYDYLNTDWQNNFAFTQDVGSHFLNIYDEIIRTRMAHPWTQADRKQQLFKRGRYAEFNLVYDRGTRFGLMTGGNPDAILMSLPPVATWD